MKIAVVAIAAVSVLGVFSLRAQDGAKSVWDGVYTEAQAKRGAAGYAEQCASCHGDQLTGGEMAPPLAGGEFLSNWNGLSAGELFERTWGDQAEARWTAENALAEREPTPSSEREARPA